VRFAITLEQEGHCDDVYHSTRDDSRNGTQTMILDEETNVHEIAETYREAYPNAKIMYPGKEDFTHRKGNGFSINKTTVGLCDIDP
jgi:hypothetical protein